MKIVERIMADHEKLITTEQGEIKYRLLKDYRGTYIDKIISAEEKMISPIFRVFDAAKPSRGRKLNIDPTQDFDPYSDSLMDYASIIGHKLNKPWKLFNRLISLQIPLCPNDCWHCYLPKELYIGATGSDHSELFSAKKIVDLFLDQRVVDRFEGKDSNVLRITGGEPFLVPRLIFECLKEIKDRNLDGEIFLWTETNLEPFVGKNGEAFMDSEENKTLLEELGKFNNFAVHPCFHGLSPEEFNLITGRSYNMSLDEQIDGLERLVRAGIDIYPTFGSNVCDPINLNNFFNKLRKLHPGLPFRVALIKYQTDYEPIEARLRFDRRKPHLYSHFASFRIWNQLLLRHYGLGYGIMPRHFFSLSDFKMATIETNDMSPIRHEPEVIFCFKSSYRALYHREILDVMAYPSDHILTIWYDEKWVQDDLFFHINLLKEQYLGRNAIWFYVDKDDQTHLPLRETEIVGVESSGEILTLKIKLKNYISFPNADKKDFAKSVTFSLSNYFGSRMLPMGGKLVMLGETFLNPNPEPEAGPTVFGLSQAFNSIKEKAEFSRDIEAFRVIVDHLSELKNMRHSVFYRVNPGGLQNKQEKNGKTLYEIKSGEAFYVDLEYFLPNYNEFDEKKPEDRTIHFESSSPTVVPIGPKKVVCSKYGSQRLNFRTLKIAREEEITLTFWSEHDEFRAAKIILNILVKPTHFKNVCNMFLTSAFFLIGAGLIAHLGQTISPGVSTQGVIQPNKELVASFVSMCLDLFWYQPLITIIRNLIYMLILGVVGFLLFLQYSRGFEVKPPKY